MGETPTDCGTVVFTTCTIEARGVRGTVVAKLCRMRVLSAFTASVAVGVAVAALAACGPGDIGADAGDDDPDGGGSGDSGLRVTWTGRGLGAPGDDLVIDRVRINLRDLRVVGDAAPGNETYVAALALDLRDTEAIETYLDRAPPGMYSALEFSVDGGADEEASWEMLGTVDLGGEIVDWQIEDEGMLPVDLALVGLDLPAGETRTIAVDLDAAAVVDDLDWEALEGNEDRITIDEDSPLMPALRGRLVDAFSIAGID